MSSPDFKELTMLFPSNRYRATRYVSDEIEDKLKSHKLIGNDDDFNISIKFEKHLPDRLIDHDVSREEFSYIIDGIIDNMCVFVYTFETTTANRINVYGKGHLMFGVTGRTTERGNIIFKIRTVYYDRNPVHRNREIKVEKIYIEDLYNDRKLKCAKNLSKYDESLSDRQPVL